jgi:hypothetical protein
MVSKISSGNSRLAATALAAASAACGTAQAAVILSPTVGSGIQPPNTPGTTFWDVDNDGVNDFRLMHFFSSLTWAEMRDTNGGRLVIPLSAPSNRGIWKLNIGFIVQASMTGSGAKFNALPLVSNTITTNGANAGNAALNWGGWAWGDTGFFGFSFTSGGNTHYGYGQMTIGAPGVAGQRFRINYAYYESTPNTPIVVGAVPEPSKIALLALGVLGLAALARRRKTNEA